MTNEMDFSNYTIDELVELKYKINCLMKNKKNFNQIWDFLIKKKLLYVSDIMPKKWFTVDNINNFIELKNIK